MQSHARGVGHVELEACGADVLIRRRLPIARGVGAALIVLALTSLTATAGAEFRGSFGFTGIRYDEEGIRPHAEVRFSKWKEGPIGAGGEVGLATMLLLNALDLNVIAPVRVGAFGFTPRFGPTLLFGYFGGEVGLGMGGRIWVQRSEGVSVAADFMYRTFRQDENDSALPLTAVGVALVW